MLTKIEQLKEWLMARARGLSDVRNVGLLLFMIVLFLITWSGIKSIETNYGLQKNISRLEQENAVRSLANQNQRLKNEYYNTSEYLDAAARQNFGLAAPGETVLIVPHKVALAHTVDLVPPAPDRAKPVAQPAYKRNLDSWMDFFMHRQHVE